MPRISSLIIPRDTLLFATGWIVVTWFLTMGVRAPLAPSPASYHLQVRLLLLMVGVGFFIGWPMFRLSQRPPRQHVLEVFLDVFTLILLWQVLFWPLGTITAWPFQSLLLLNVLVCLWTLIIGAIVALGLRIRGSVFRLVAMVVVLVLTLLPLAIALGMVIRGHQPAAWTSSSPLELIRQVASPSTLESNTVSVVLTFPWIWLTVLSLVAVLSWISAITWRPSSPATESLEQPSGPGE